MNEVKEGLRDVFQTKNDLTLPVSATGSSGMETCFVNLLEPGDKVLVRVNGVFGNRMCDIAERCGAWVILQGRYGELASWEKAAMPTT